MHSRPGNDLLPSLLLSDSRGFLQSGFPCEMLWLRRRRRKFDQNNFDLIRAICPDDLFPCLFVTKNPPNKPKPKSIFSYRDCGDNQRAKPLALLRNLTLSTRAFYSPSQAARYPERAVAQCG